MSEGRGRPEKSNGKKCMGIRFRVTKEEKEKLKDAAETTNGGNISDFVRSAVLKEAEIVTKKTTEGNLLLRPWIKPFIMSFIEKAYADENYKLPNDPRGDD